MKKMEYSEAEEIIKKKILELEKELKAYNRNLNDIHMKNINESLQEAADEALPKIAQTENNNNETPNELNNLIEAWKRKHF